MLIKKCPITIPVPKCFEIDAKIIQMELIQQMTHLWHIISHVTSTMFSHIVLFRVYGVQNECDAICCFSFSGICLTSTKVSVNLPKNRSRNFGFHNKSVKPFNYSGRFLLFENRILFRWFRLSIPVSFDYISKLMHTSGNTLLSADSATHEWLMIFLL